MRIHQQQEKTLAEIDKLFRVLISQEGSDLHLKQGQRPKIRIHGHLEDIRDSDVLSENAMLMMMKEITDKKEWQRFQDRGDLDFAYSLGEDARFRANYFRHFHGVGAVFRIIPSKILTLEELDMPKVIKTFGNLHSGLVLVTGPTGSGKSTTLAGLVDFINETRKLKMVTIEEPVEFIHRNKNSIITHREVGLDTESFATGLKSAIKSDVNAVLVGEMRDQETIELALTAAQMGILVFGTLHTNSAPKTIDRIIDVFPANKKSQIRTILSNTIQGVVSQQLIKSHDLSRRYVAYEILVRTPALASIITQDETFKILSEIQVGGNLGMILMDECLLRLLKEGKVSPEDAYMKALDKDNFIKKAGLQNLFQDAGVEINSDRYGDS